MTDFAFRSGGPRHLLAVQEAWEKEAHDHPANFTPGAHKLLAANRPKAFRALQKEQVANFNREKD